MSAFSRYLGGEPISADLFRQLCEEHDLTYVYADDHAVWELGSQELITIRKAQRELGDEVAFSIWNSIVDKKIGEAYRDQFYWRLPE